MPAELLIVGVWFTAFLLSTSVGFSLIGPRHFIPLAFKRRLAMVAAVTTIVAASFELGINMIPRGDWGMLSMVWSADNRLTDDMLLAGNLRGIMVSLFGSIIVALFVLISSSRVGRERGFPTT